MKYTIRYTSDAKNDLRRLLKDEPLAYKKVLQLIAELYEHPTIGTGKPKMLKGDLSGKWSRRITQKHRLVYEIIDNEVVVLVISAYGHYDDK